jgi:hypothetical protein
MRISPDSSQHGYRRSQHEQHDTLQPVLLGHSEKHNAGIVIATHEK